MKLFQKMPKKAIFGLFFQNFACSFPSPSRNFKNPSPLDKILDQLLFWMVFTNVFINLYALREVTQ